MTLVELCEPLFQYVCRLNRMAAAGTDIPASQIRAEVQTILAQIRARAAETPGMLNLYEIKEGRDGKSGVELAIIGFVDFMVRESRLECARDWEDIAASEHDEFAMDDKFFDLLEETLAQRGQHADEQLAVFYTCMGLGFTGHGQYKDNPALLRRKMHDCAARIPWMRQDSPLVCPEAYEHTDTRALDLPPTGNLVRIGVIAVVLIALLFGMFGWFYHGSQRALQDHLTAIIKEKAE